MPRCIVCGNSQSFGSSRIPAIAPYTNGPMSAVVGQFDEDSEVVTINSLGAVKKLITEASKNPREYFDICMQCGSNKIIWD